MIDFINVIFDVIILLEICFILNVGCMLRNYKVVV